MLCGLSHGEQTIFPNLGRLRGIAGALNAADAVNCNVVVMETSYFCQDGWISMLHWIPNRRARPWPKHHSVPAAGPQPESFPGRARKTPVQIVESGGIAKPFRWLTMRMHSSYFAARGPLYEQ